MKVREIIVIDDAMIDLEIGRAFYDAQEKGVGDYFWDSIIGDLESLIIYAGIHQKVFGLHRMTAKRFPYAVYYDIMDDIASIIAVLPMRRDPFWIRQKLRNRNE